MVTEQLAELMQAALEAATRDGILPEGSAGAIPFERPKRREHGDWATNVALTAAKGAGTNPPAIAEALVERIPPSELIESVEVAGPGFLNFRLSPSWLHDVVRRARNPTSPARPGNRWERSTSSMSRPTPPAPSTW